jgi:hypothetical protein
MGRSADAARKRRPNTGGVATKDPLLAEISALLAASEAEDDPARLERTLTDGYARALWLEADHRRLERRIGSLAASGQGDAERQELASLLGLAKRQEGDLGTLRHQLGLLRRRHSSAARRATQARI